MQTQGPASSNAQEICVRGDGAEVCAANLTFTASGTLTFTGFVPEPAANVVSHLSPTTFRLNRIDSVAPGIGTLRYGELQIGAAPGSCPTGACLVTVDLAEVIEADLDVSTASLATSTNTIATVPEPDPAIALALGCLALLIARTRKGRGAPRVLWHAIVLATFWSLAAGSAGAALGPCGDVDEDGVISASDLSLYRAHLADPTGVPLGAVGAARCQVSLDSSGCDLLSAVVLSRRLAVPLREPGIQPACSDVAALDLGVTLAPGDTTRVVGAGSEILELTAADGTLFRLTFPANSVTTPGGVVVSMREISSVSGFDGSGGFIGGVQLDPDGLVLEQIATLRIEFATPPAATQLAALAFEGTGGDANFFPVPLDSLGAVSVVEFPISHFSGFAAVGASSDEVASTPWPPTPLDAPHMHRLVDILQTGVEQGLVGLDFDSNTDAATSVTNAMRDWLGSIEGRASPSFDTCADINETFRSLNSWSIQDQLFGTGLDSSSDPDDQTAWSDMQTAITPAYGILNERYTQAANYCASHEDDPCGQFLERYDALNCQIVSDFLLQRFGLPDTPNNIHDLCPGSPEKMVFQRQDLLSNAPFEACPMDASFAVTATVQTQAGLPISISDPFTWSTSNSSVLGVLGADKVATVTPTGGLGPVALSAQWTACPEFPASTNTFVGVAPSLVGWWTTSGIVFQTGCWDPEENFPPSFILLDGEIEAQITNPDGTVTFNIFGPGWGGIATLECGGLGATFAGSEAYFFEDGYGINIYNGTMTSQIGPPGQRVATGFSWTWEANDVVGDTCHAEGAGTLVR